MRNQVIFLLVVIVAVFSSISARKPSQKNVGRRGNDVCKIVSNETVTCQTPIPEAGNCYDEANLLVSF
jgi:hypothetical protein